MNHRLDTDERVLFYENEFYPLSNFSAFELELDGQRFPTSEHAYHFFKFPHVSMIQLGILYAGSAHAAWRYAQTRKDFVRSDWADVKVGVMRRILRAKVEQHEYVRRKLLQTGDRELIEDSWRDDFWGWGENQDGQNQLGKLWMELRDELRRTIGNGGSR